MHLHILGICGTFMGSLAILAKQLGHQVSGSDANVYPPMSTQLEAQGITLMEGFSPLHLDPEPDLVIVGNAMSRGNDAVEHVLARGIPYTSGPQWLRDHVLEGRWVIALAGTHGKTTTTSMVTWILEDVGLEPGYLVGGVPKNFEVSARLGADPFFVVEADEYDSAFFDKRSKFVHYLPRTLVLNNMEFDHADIFDDLAAIQRQFHHVIRTVPNNGLIIAPAADAALEETLAMGCWTPTQRFGVSGNNDWSVALINDDGSEFDVLWQGERCGVVRWNQTGMHNVNNALAAIAASHHAGVRVRDCIDALCRFEGVKRRMECLGTVNGVTVYDDFAHHPTAIETTLDGLRKQVGDKRIIAIIEPRSNTMRMGVHQDRLAQSVRDATEVIWYQPEGADWKLSSVVEGAVVPSSLEHSIDGTIQRIVEGRRDNDHVVIMSNGGFGGIHRKLLAALVVK
ncbi:UDP-N-acetylmuramate:L-alanyl-gamma-D-glutamyl-meso-diaminopimelate ligase [Gammaproteobacteria bacterium 45_16_T64]|nr:UDP-N-acetylmuramate:L-alanyl-gamma-D-glutamyl-meso-diaminopimelate ligase [Gammaproteobacteria bacterium 45_16_T64]